MGREKTGKKRPDRFRSKGIDFGLTAGGETGLQKKGDEGSGPLKDPLLFLSD